MRTTFDLNVQASTADAARHLTMLIGQVIAVSNPAGTYHTHARLGGVNVFAQPRGYSICLDFKSMPHQYSDVIVVDDDPGPEPEPADPRLRAALAVIRRPPRREA